MLTGNFGKVEVEGGSELSVMSVSKDSEMFERAEALLKIEALDSKL